MKKQAMTEEELRLNAEAAQAPPGRRLSYPMEALLGANNFAAETQRTLRRALRLYRSKNQSQ